LASLPSDFAVAGKTSPTPGAFVMMIGLALPFFLGPLIAEAGYVFQKAYLRPFVWRALLWLWVLLLIVSAVTLSMFMAMPHTPVPTSDRLLSLASWTIGLMQLIPMWRYAYRSGHLWMPVTA
jgi:hypothetical protein